MFKPISVWSILLITAFFSFDSGVWAGDAQIPSLLECSPVSTNPKSKKFVTALALSFSDGSFKGERKTESRPGKESYSGSIDRDQAIRIAGQGGYQDGSDSWRSTFSGTLSKGGTTVLRGYLDTARRSGRRDCSITFLPSSDKLASLLTGSSAPAVPDPTVQAKQQLRSEWVQTSTASPAQQQAGPTRTGTGEQKPQTAAAVEKPAAAGSGSQNASQAEPSKSTADVTANSPVNDYIVAHGGCAALSRSWEAEFHRPDRAPPYGKPFVNWDQDDFLVLRKWVGQCLDPYLVQRGLREQSLQIYDSKVRTYQREQEQARAEARRQEQLAAETKAQLDALIARYDSSLTRAQVALQEFEPKAATFLDQTANVQLSDMARMLQLGREAASLGSIAQNAASQASTAASAISRFGYQQVQRPFLDDRHKNEVTSQQIEGVRARVQNAASRVGTTLDRLELIQSRYQPCSQRLSEAAVPKEIIETKIFSANGDLDNYLFEVICPSNNTRLVYSAASWSSKQVEFDLGTAPVRLWFDLRDDDGSKTWTQELSGGPTPRSRLVLRRVRSGSTDESAQANWESVNLLNTAVLLLALSQ
ncbi:hypothetical protein IVA98_06235 [Bradyrhizobium sp. 160]|uniref:hypothetical protein n=1 Tax=Bradyrhizobium sp. 160 TaxID=2782634 RepID=UPI001FF781BA|nr:hypothetical protein [Bradyrhizobium sp. 160]MCK1622852.1 hypothetical protein [Bradyrhizobium sp. 160]